MRKVSSPSITMPDPTSKMYEVWPSRRASSITCARRRPDLITTSTPARWHASRARAGRSVKLPSPSREERGAETEQGAVEVRIDAAQRHYQEKSCTISASPGDGGRRPAARGRRAPASNARDFRRDPDRVEPAHLDHLVVQLHAAASREHDVDLLGLLVAMCESVPLAGLDDLKRHAGGLGLEVAVRSAPPGRRRSPGRRPCPPPRAGS